MGKRLINAKINVTKIDKAKLFKGKKGTYLDITLIETPGGKYGDWMIVQDNKKEDQGQATILGNGKNRNWGENSGAKNDSAPVTSDDLPY